MTGDPPTTPIAHLHPGTRDPAAGDRDAGDAEQLGRLLEAVATAVALAAQQG